MQARAEPGPRGVTAQSQPDGSGVLLELYYGKALRHVPVGTSLQDRGIHFRLTTALY